MRDKGEFLFTSESVSEGPPGQGGGPDQRHGARRLSRGGPRGARRLRNDGDDQPHHPGRRGTRGPEGVNETLEHAVREAVRDIGYDQKGFSWRHAEFHNYLHEQSADIAVGVDSAGNKDEGAGDQGIMFGFATRETPSLMPAPLHYAHGILHRINTLRKAGDARARGLLPDAKSQVTLRYIDGKPVGATSVVISTQHEENLTPGRRSARS